MNYTYENMFIANIILLVTSVFISKSLIIFQGDIPVQIQFVLL